MFGMESYHPPMRITDLLNPVHASDVPPPHNAIHTHSHSPPLVRDVLPRAHTQLLPSFSALENNSHVYVPQARFGAERGRGMQDFPAGSRADQVPMQMMHTSQEEARAGTREGSNPRAKLTEAQEHAQHYGLRAANWKSARARFPPPPMREDSDASASFPQEERPHNEGAETASASANDALPVSVQPISMSMNMQAHSLSPMPGFAASHFASPPTMLAFAHSPYGQQQQQQLSFPPPSAMLGPHPYAPHLAARPHLVPLVAPSPVPSPGLPSLMASSDYGNATMAAGITSNHQQGERASVRIAARETNEASSAREQSPYVLQLHPSQQQQQQQLQGQKKRSHGEANANSEESTPSTSAPRSSASSVSSLSSLSSLNSVPPVADVSDHDVEDSTPQAKKARGKAKSVTPPNGKKSNAAQRGKASKKRNDLEGNASNANSNSTNQAVSSQKGKEREITGINYHYPYSNGQIAFVDPHMTMQIGYAVSVMPIQEGGMPVMRHVGFPYPMSMHPLGPGMPVAVAAQNQQQAKLFPELQFARCMSARYRTDVFPRCVSCTRRWAGDTCRFQNIRVLLRDANKNLVAAGFQSLNAKSEGAQLMYPEKWNIELEKRHVNRIMETVAKALLPHLQKEQAHQLLGNVVKRQRETDVRATCDTCMTSLFSSSWMCRQCGREACEECYQTICRLTAEPTPTSTPVANGKGRGAAASGSAQRSIRERHAQANPFFLSCNRKAEHGVHTFNPVTRFVQTELDDAVTEMLRLVEKERMEVDNDGTVGSERENGEIEKDGADRDKNPGMAKRDRSIDVHTSRSLSPASRDASERHEDGTMQGHANKDASNSNGSSASRTTPLSLTPDVYDDGICTLVKNPIQPSFSSSLTDLPSTSATELNPPTWPIPYYAADDLSEPVFAAQWARGMPLVVTGLLDRFDLRWTPQYFTKTYGTQPCIILECQTEANKKVTVGEFFNCFGQYEGRTECWKLKDWPPSTDFKTAFPELYDDFSRAVPIPNYSRRDGAMNIASHFPLNTVAPDLGPKMYNAYASNEDKGTKGTTRLHMDMADAVNIMLHAELTADGSPGCAAWDIFRAEDSLHLRSFFKRHFKGKYQNDPIHAQTFYLDTDQRRQLFEEFGVRSFRIYQRPGEAVFIPAGCAHQVCNLADSIKVACDFVSPENVERCETLTREFRAQNQSLVWKEDVLQLRSMMWFAWLSCRKQQAKWCRQHQAKWRGLSGDPAVSSETQEAGDNGSTLTTAHISSLVVLDQSR